MFVITMTIDEVNCLQGPSLRENKLHLLALAAHNQFHDLTYAGLIVPNSYFITDFHVHVYFLQY